MSRVRDVVKEGFWRDHVGCQESSGKSVSDYCRRWGLSQSLFYWWRRRLVADGVLGRKAAVKCGDFVEVTDLVGSVGVVSWDLEIALGCGAVVRVGRGFDVSRLVAVLGAVKGC